jgi:hypothetical protein
MDPIRRALQTASDELHVKGIVKDPAALAVHTEIANKFNEFMALSPAERTPLVVDAFKQSIGEIQQRAQPGTMARRTADQIYHATKGEIARQVPDYTQAMKGYQDASEGLKEIRGTFSINDRALTDTTLRKLQSTMRNNVNTNYGARTKLLDELARHQPDLPYALAGQALNSMTPRGLAAGGAGIHTLYGMATNPTSLAMLPATSPRLMGEVLHGAGQASRMGGAFLDGIGMSPQGLDRAFLMEHALNQVTQAPREENMGLSGTIRPKGTYTYGLEE